MSKKKQDKKPAIEKEASYYRLHTEAVKSLVEADESNSPEVSEEELRKYTSGNRFNIPMWGKMLFIKFWFAGAVCFFFLWGLSSYMADLMDTLFVTGIALGIVTDLLTNNALRFIEKTQGEAERWIMVTVRGYASFLLNILYSFVVLFLVYTLYNMINAGYAMATGKADVVLLGVGPILFGLFYLGFDLLLIQYKRWMIDIFGKRKSHVAKKT